VFEGSDQELVGQIYLSIYILISLLLLMNLFIAIMSSTYAYYENLSESLYCITMVKEIPFHFYDPYYGSLTYAQIPTNMVVLPFVPFMSCMKKN